jgi:ABC-type Mn2+/Zn2+ transport system permease subunit
MTDAEFLQAFWTIAVGIVCNVSCALIGCYLVLRRLSLLGDAISHGVLPGIVLAVLVSGQLSGWPILLGAMVCGVLTAALTQTLQTVGKVPEDSSMGVVFSALFALGVLLISRQTASRDLDLDCVFNGVLETVVLDTVEWGGLEIPRAFPTMALALGVTLAVVLLFWKELKIVSFDPALASAMGISALLVHYLLMALVAAVTVASFEAVGSILVVAMLVVPAATAHLLTDRLWLMMVWAAVIAVVSAVLGYVLASEHVLNSIVSGMMAVVAGAQFVLAVLFAPRHGVAARGLRNARLALRIAGEDALAALFRAQEAGAAAPAVGGGLWPRLAVLWLRRQGLVRRAADGTAALTDPGRQRAQSLVRAHRLWEAYLGENFDLPPDHLHDPATRMEHFIGPALQGQLASELNHPAVDPHGKPIPPSQG